MENQKLEGYYSYSLYYDYYITLYLCTVPRGGSICIIFYTATAFLIFVVLRRTSE